MLMNDFTPIDWNEQSMMEITEEVCLDLGDLDYLYEGTTPEEEKPNKVIEKAKQIIKRVKTFFAELIQKVKDHIADVKKFKVQKEKEKEVKKYVAELKEALKANPKAETTCCDFYAYKRELDAECKKLDNIVSKFVTSYTRHSGISIPEAQRYVKLIQKQLEVSNLKLDDIRNKKVKMKVIDVIRFYELNDMTGYYDDLITNLESYEDDIISINEKIKTHADEAGYILDDSTGLSHLLTQIKNTTVFVKRNADWLIPHAMAAITVAGNAIVRKVMKNNNNRNTRRLDAISSISILGNDTAAKIVKKKADKQKRNSI